MTATLGDIEFMASEEKTLTYKELSFTHSASYTEHTIIGRKGLLEFTGLNASTCSLKITLNASMGHNPSEVIRALKSSMDTNEALPFTIGGNVIGSGLWVIESMAETHGFTSPAGELLSAELSINLKEYIDDRV